MTAPQLDAAAIQAFGSDSKIGLLATVDPGGLPHVSLITTLQAADPARLTFGQFCEGASKRNVRRDPRAAFVVMGLDRHLWRGTACWTGAASEGPEFEAYNRKPLFRYNSYFGIHTVHFLDLRSVGPREALSLPRIAAGGLAATAARPVLARRGLAEAPLHPWACGLANRLDSLKFVSWVGADGYPRLVPAVPADAADPGRLVLVATAYGRELAEAPVGGPVAVFILSLKMESVLVGGRLSPWRAGLATVEIDRVYNSMPPKQGPVWPREG